LSIRNWVLAAILALVIVQLNFYFAWTSHVGVPNLHSTSPIRSFFEGEVNYVARTQLSIPGVAPYFMNLARSSRPHFGSSLSGLEMRFFIDYEVVAFTLLIFVVSLLLFEKKGIGVSILRAFEITSAAVLPLGLDIYFFDHAEFNIHASAVQVKAGLGWITNADVLYISSGILAVTLAIEAARYARRKRLSAKTISLKQQYAAPTATTTP
jgi:lysylphosphatidylglycerol synthetase-like protein (DUF2156 family)